MIIEYPREQLLRANMAAVHLQQAGIAVTYLPNCIVRTSELKHRVQFSDDDYEALFEILERYKLHP